MDIPLHHPFRSSTAEARYLELNERRSKSWPVSCECRTVDTPHGHTFMRVCGPVDAPPLVLLPGGGNHSLIWCPIIESVSESHRTYAVDNIFDIGRSFNTLPIEAPGDLVSWLDELFDALGLSSGVRLMGLSYGGWLSSQYALSHSGRLDKLVLLAPAFTLLPLRPAFMLRMASCLVPPRRFFIERTYRWCLPDLVATGETGRRVIEEMTEDLSLAYQCYPLRRLVSMVPPTVLSDEELRDIEIPTLVVLGGNERMYSCREAIDRVQEVAPEIETAEIAGAGHDMTWVQPELLSAKVLEFLA